MAMLIKTQEPKHGRDLEEKIRTKICEVAGRNGGVPSISH